MLNSRTLLSEIINKAIKDGHARPLGPTITNAVDGGDVDRPLPDNWPWPELPRLIRDYYINVSDYEMEDSTIDIFERALRGN